MTIPRFLRSSVRGKLTALVVLTTLAALVITAVAMVSYNVSDYRDTKLAELRTQAEIVGRASAPALAFNDPDEATEDLAMLGGRGDIEHAALYAIDGSLFASYARDGTGPVLSSAPGLPGEQIDGDIVTLVYPVIEDGQPVGTVVLSARYGLRARLIAYILILMSAMVVALLAAVLLSSWLQRAVTAPILRLADAARAVVDRRDLTVRAAKTTEDEIGVAADAMNRMLADLEREIAERRSAEEALRAGDRRKDEFLATLAHELRNPLAPIRNALYLMRMGGNDAKTMAEARAIVERQVLQLVRLVDDLLEVSRITTGKLSLRRERVELRAVATSALEAVQPLMIERRHRLDVSLPPAGLAIEGDPTRLAQVFLNLLNNAAKFTEPGGHIEFSLEVKDGEMIGRVRDDGVGIAPNMLDAIFEMFAQADRSLERTTMGLGVGLSLSRKLMELHGGSVVARSEGPGRGAEFTVRMPARDWNLPSPRGPSDRDGPSPEVRPRVLIVDDNRDFADTLGRMLHGKGYEARVEHDGLAGLAAAQEFRPHIAFVDIGMPKLNGYDLAKRMRELPLTRGTILIAVTGWGQDEDRVRTEQAGFDAHLVKPVEPDDLLKLLAHLSAPERS